MDDLPEFSPLLRKHALAVCNNHRRHFTSADNAVCSQRFHLLKNTLYQIEKTVLRRRLAESRFLEEFTPVPRLNSRGLSFIADLHRHFLGKMKICLRADQIIKRCKSGVPAIVEK